MPHATHPLTQLTFQREEMGAHIMMENRNIIANQSAPLLAPCPHHQSSLAGAVCSLARTFPCVSPYPLPPQPVRVASCSHTVFTQPNAIAPVHFTRAACLHIPHTNTVPCWPHYANPPPLAEHIRTNVEARVSAPAKASKQPNIIVFCGSVLAISILAAGRNDTSHSCSKRVLPNWLEELWFGLLCRGIPYLQGQYSGYKIFPVAKTSRLCEPSKTLVCFRKSLTPVTFC